MKHLFRLSFLFFFFSCSSIEKEIEPIGDIENLYRNVSNYTPGNYTFNSNVKIVSNIRP